MWLNCTPSARLGEKYERTSNEAADEGTLAHSLCELLLKRILKRIKESDYIAKVKAIKANKLYNSSMMEHCTQFAAYVMERYNSFKDAIIFLETVLDLSTHIPEGFGTGDVIIISGNEMVVIDLKYGKGVFVDAEENTQMMIYALGAIDNFSMVSNVKKVTMTIYQPRLDNISSFMMTVPNLSNWGDELLIPKAKIAFTGKGKLVAGSHCTFCPAKATCKAHATYNLKLAGEEFDEAVQPADLKDTELVELYLRAKQIRSWLSAIEDHMLDKAIKGKNWKGLKLVHGRSVRVMADPVKILQILKSKKFPAKLYLSEPALLGITALEKNIGAQEFIKMAGKYIAKPKGKASLVHADNKGQDYNASNSAKEDFS